MGIYLVVFLSGLLLLLSVILYRKKSAKNRFSITLLMLIVAFNLISDLLAIGCLFFAQDDITWSVVYTLTHELKGADISHYVLQFTFLFATIVILLFLTYKYIGKGRGIWNRYDTISLIMAFFALCLSPVVIKSSKLIINQLYGNTEDFKAYFITQKKVIKNPKYNLVYIYAESLERTWFDEKRFPDLLPELSRDLRDATSFTDTEQLPGTGFTIGGIVASQCGLPLFFPLSLNTGNVVNNFYPKAECLGDILKASGYENYFFQGADIHFSDKDVFLKNHGFDYVYGKYQLNKNVPSGYVNAWGLYDDTLLDKVWDKFVELSKKGRRFSLFTLTVDTHPPKGFVSEHCQRNVYFVMGEKNDSLSAIACSQEIISRFIRRIRTSEWAEQTVVVLSSDHLSMANSATFLLPKKISDRHDLFAVFKGREPLQLTNIGKRSTLDNGATVLEILGGEKKIGLGRSSLSLPSLSSVFDPFSKKLDTWQSKIIELWNASDNFKQYTVQPASNILVAEGENYHFPVMLTVVEGRMYPLINKYQDLRSAYLNLKKGTPFIWIDRCYILSKLDRASTHYQFSTQYCIARGLKDESVDLRLTGDAEFEEKLWFPESRFSSSEAREIAHDLRSDSDIRYDAPGVRFNLPGRPACIKSIEGLSYTETWGRWSNAKIAPQVTLQYTKKLPGNFTLRIRAKAYGKNIGQPVTIQIGDKTETAVFNETPTTVTLKFNNVSDADKIIITPPNPELDVTSGGWTPLDQNGRLIAVGLIDLQIL